MSRNLLALACVLLAFYLVHVVHAKLYRAVGHRRAGRFAAYVVATIGYGTTGGLAVALAGDGWHRSRGVLPVYTHTSVPEGLIGGAALGLLVGVVLFLGAEHRGGRPMFDDPFAEVPLGPAFPPEYVQDVLDFEPRAPRVECVQMARSMRRVSRRTGEPLPPELAAFVERHDSGRRSRRSRGRRR
jgi:hypothetical protein